MYYDKSTSGVLAGAMVNLGSRDAASAAGTIDVRLWGFTWGTMVAVELNYKKFNTKCRVSSGQDLLQGHNQ